MSRRSRGKFNTTQTAAGDRSSPAPSGLLGNKGATMLRARSREITRVLIVIAAAFMAVAGGSAAVAAGQGPVLRKLTVPQGSVGQPYSYDVSKVLFCPT